MVIVGIIIYAIGLIAGFKLVNKVGESKNDHIFPIIIWPISIFFLLFRIIKGSNDHEDLNNLG